MAAAQQNASFLSVHRLEKHYDGVAAVRGVDLEVAAGELVTLLGPSGSGKTTLLMAIAGFADPDRGRIVLDGRDITHLQPHRRDIGVVFQQYALFPHLTVAQNVAYPLVVRKIPRAEREAAVAEALRLVQLESYGTRYPKQLSGGQQQRVALARALVFKPPVLLMDEPLGALDRKLRTEMQLEIRRIQQRLKITTIYVTHDQEEALTISDRIAVMNRGRIEQIASPQEIYAGPATAFVADFVGDSNLLPVVITSATEPVFIAQCEADPDWKLPVKANSRFIEGDRAAVLVRPEDILIAAHPTSLCQLRGIVDERVYLGSVTRIQIRTSSGRQITATVKPELTRPAGNAQAEIWFGWEPDRAVLVPVL